MSAQLPSEVLQVPGRLVVGPTSFTGPYPYGGTPIGYSSNCYLVKETEYAYAMSEARGRAKTRTYRGATSAALIFTLMQFDPDAYNKLWASTTTSAGGYAGANTLSLPQVGTSRQPGAITPDSPLLFAPDTPEYPAVIFYAPSWCDETRQKLALALNRPLESLVVVVCGLDSANRDLAWGRLEDLSPT